MRLKPDGRVGLPNLTKISSLHRQLKQAKLEAKTDRKRLRKLHLQQGGIRSDLGLVRVGLRDCLRALLDDLDSDFDSLLNRYPQAVASGEGSAGEHARAAEAVRMYVRDAVLAKGANLKGVKALLGHAVDGFTIAERKIRSLPVSVDAAVQEARDEQAGWIVAHRASTLTLLVWLSFLESSPGDPSKIDQTSFKRAASDFAEARHLLTPERRVELSLNALWCIQFEAFLFALHGTDDSFVTARKKLESLADAKGILPSGIHRCRAMLSGYVAASPRASAEVRAEASLESIESGLSGALADSEDDKVLYNCAASCWALLRAKRELRQGQGPTPEQAEEDETLAEDLRNYIESAETRALDQASQSIIVLIGLELLKGQTSLGLEKQRAFERANTLAKLFREGSIAPGLEAQAMFVRDPVFTTLVTADDCKEDLALFKPNFNLIRTQYSSKLAR